MWIQVCSTYTLKNHESTVRYSKSKSKGGIVSLASGVEYSNVPQCH